MSSTARARRDAAAATPEARISKLEEGFDQVVMEEDSLQEEVFEGFSQAIARRRRGAPTTATAIAITS